MKQKTLHFVLTRVFNTPLMIHPQKLQMIENVLRSRMPAGVFFDSEDDPSPDEVETGGPSGERVDNMTNVAVIPVYGSLVQRNVNISDCFTSYTSLERQLNAALEDPAVQGILFDVDSCGGEANGCFELVDRIYEARKEKTIMGLGNEQAFSGGYAILSACEKVWIPKTGNVGSIGVIMTHFDYSKMADKEGVAITHIIAGKKKADGSPYRPLSPAALKDFQTEVDQLYDVFVNSCARNRGLATKAVRSTEAGTFMGRAALNAGLVDDVISLADLPAKITEAIMKKQTAGASASANRSRQRVEGESPAAGDDTQTAGDAADDSEGSDAEDTTRQNPPATDDTAAGAAGARPTEEDDDDEEEEDSPPAKKKAAAAASTDPVKVARETAAEITRMCVTMGKPALAAQLIEKGMTVNAAKAHLFDVLAGSESTQINAVDTATTEVSEGRTLMVGAMRKINDERNKAR